MTRDDLPYRTIVRTNGTTTCCDTKVYVDREMHRRCVGCDQEVHMTVWNVPDDKEIQYLIAGSAPCGPRKRRKAKATTARRGRGKGKK